MKLHKQPYLRIPDVTDMPASLMRELREWLLAIVAISLAVWISRAVGQIIFGLAMRLLWRFD